MQFYPEIKEKFGDDRVSGANLFPFLDGYGFSSKQKGEYISQFATLSDKAKSFADSGNYEKVYQYYNIKSNADSDGKGLSITELKSYFERSGMSQEEKRAWFRIYFPDSKNPY